MFSIVQIKTATLDYGIPGVSPAHMLLLFLVALAVPMIPFLFLFFSLPGEKDSAPVSLKNSPAKSTGKPFKKASARVHVQNPGLLHH